MPDASPQHFHVGSPNKGGEFLLVPPGYTGEISQSGYHVVRAPLHNYNDMVCGILTGGLENVQEAVQTVKKLKIYPWSERSNPKPNKFISMSNAEIDTLPPQGMEYWSRLSAYINNNPVQEPDLFYLGMLTSSGWSSIRLLIYVKGGPTNWIKKLVVNFIQTRFECEAYPHTGCVLRGIPAIRMSASGPEASAPPQPMKAGPRGLSPRGIGIST